MTPPSTLIDLSALSPLERAQLAGRLERDLLNATEPIYLYAIQAGDNGPIKIGLAKTPWERLKTLQTGNHEQLRGLAAWRVHPVTEQILHEQFADARIRGEWFHPVPELVETVLYEGGIFSDWERPPR